MKYAADFLTTGDLGAARVWLFCIKKIGEAEKLFGGSLPEFFELLETADDNPAVYVYELKDIGEFIISYLFMSGYKYREGDGALGGNEFTTLIGSGGGFYKIEVCFYRDERDRPKRAVFYDIKKIIPLPFGELCKTFCGREYCGSIDKTSRKSVFDEITIEEIGYIGERVDILAEAMGTVLDRGIRGVTIGASALKDYKETIGERSFRRLFPPPGEYDTSLREGYKGGYVYLNPNKRGVEIGEGIILDFNSMYPYILYSKPMPYGEGIYYEGEYQEDKVYNIYVQFLICSFRLKPGHLPTYQVRGVLDFEPMKFLEDSAGEAIPICMTSPDLKLFFEHYDVKDVEYIFGWKFRSRVGMFKEYIDFWANEKAEASERGDEGWRFVSKMMLNQLGGKFATDPTVYNRIPYMREEDNTVAYYVSAPRERPCIYIPVAEFMTAYAREEVVSVAQANFDRYIYSDTDSLHLEGPAIPEGLKISPVRMGCWKVEKKFRRARYLKQKVYITEDESGECEAVCAGMPEACKEYVLFDNFVPGHKYPGREIKRRVKGGYIIEQGQYTLSDK